MHIPVEHKNTSGHISNLSFNLSWLGFAKHMAIAGQGYAPRPQKLLRTIGMFFHYSYYLQYAFLNDRFSEPPISLSDPTEKGQFSNLAGKAIADFLSKKIDGSLFTVNYEAAMRLQGKRVSGQRPDLIAFTPTSMFAIEAKGRHQSNPGNIASHKAQAQSGPLNVNYSVACISYNLFTDINCIYHDPYNADIPFDNVTFKAATKNYYSGLAEFMKLKYFKYRPIELQGESFYEIILSFKNYEKYFPVEFPFLRPFWFFPIFEQSSISLILPLKINEYAIEGISRETRPFNFEIDQEDDYETYIDVDRVGLRMRKRNAR